ncbi:MAG: hypothetical protein K0U34_05475 [Alphaproteobacteria bacterium]|nr:hypothetical protein [Alphaproteobacteria bacterium]
MFNTLNGLYKIGFAVLLLGWVPLGLYVLLGPADGNPIGLGLLFLVCNLIAVPVLIIAVLKSLSNNKSP